MEVVDVEIAVRDAKLSGTLTLPDPDIATGTVVLCIHGSGPLDRDENIGDKQRLDVFNTIADDLVDRGVACLRYDKRGVGKSTGDYMSASYDDFVLDAIACLDFLRRGRAASFEHFYLLGHSEGTIVAATMASERGGIDGLVLLAPFLARMEDTLMAQAEHMAAALPQLPGLTGALLRASTRIWGSPLRQQARLIDKLRETTDPVIRQGLRKVPAAHLRGLLALDPPAIYAEVKVPTLLISGGKDLQCDPQDGPRIAAMLGANLAKAVVLPNLTHVLRNDPEPPSFLRYAALIEGPVAKEVIDLVGEWIAPPAPRSRRS